jgi:hypothetical protein
MMFPGVEVGIQLRFINKMEERSPSCLVSLDMDLLMGPFVVCAVHARATRAARSRARARARARGARSQEQHVWG